MELDEEKHNIKIIEHDKINNFIIVAMFIFEVV